MSVVTQQMHGTSPSPVFEQSELGTKTVGEPVFGQLFRSAHAERPRRDAGEHHPDDAATVGNPTVGCQQDGASADMDASEREGSSLGIGAGDGEDDGESKEKKFSKNSELLTLASAFNPQADHRVLTRFEAAGIPRREIARLAHALHESAVTGRQSVSLGLRVPELGELRFDVRIVGKVVLIHAFVETEQTAAALALAIATLREKLEDHQLVLGRLDVTTTDDRGSGKQAKGDDASLARKREKRGRPLPLPSLERLEREDGCDE